MQPSETHYGLIIWCILDNEDQKKTLYFQRDFSIIQSYNVVSECKQLRLTVRVYDNYNLIALQGLDTDDIEGCEFSKKFRAETSGDMEKLMACVGH